MPGFFPDLTPDIMNRLPKLRGRLRANQELAPFTWFRVGGPAQVFFSPADEEDLCYFLQNRPEDLPLQVIGVGSNLLVRDGGLPGITIRLNPNFAKITQEGEAGLRAGAMALDSKLSQAALQAGLGGFAFFRGIPGTLGGALTMNAGALGGETADNLTKVRAVTMQGELKTFPASALKLAYRHSAPPEPLIYVDALFEGEPQDPALVKKAMDEAVRHREENQPVKSRTGGSTFKNPPEISAWKAVDQADCRGLVVGDAQVSKMHCNFLINRGNASASDIENLGEEVRRRVRESQGIELQWEIKRIGLPVKV